MSAPEERERESQETSETNFDERVDEEHAERDTAAERLRNDPLPEPGDE